MKELFIAVLAFLGGFAYAQMMFVEKMNMIKKTVDELRALIPKTKTDSETSSE